VQKVGHPPCSCDELSVAPTARFTKSKEGAQARLPMLRRADHWELTQEQLDLDPYLG
jgi:hypothetical protein